MSLPRFPLPDFSSVYRRLSSVVTFLTNKLAKNLPRVDLCWLSPDASGQVHQDLHTAFHDVRIRRLTSADKSEFLGHLLRLDPEARRNRFAMIASDAFLQTYAETAFSLDSVIFAYEEEGAIRAAGELRGLLAQDNGLHQSEAAFSVEADWRRKGIGTRLMELTLLEAEALNVRLMYVNCLSTNRRMQALAKKFGANLSFERGDVIGLLSPNASSGFRRVRDETREVIRICAAV
ncbi:GNAT family N-acetyltransferase [Roseibium sp.]|uniref:GNAT family N-acetyltransferase n=1 Tax=Roseibium sp. TaxID=1936156 RepID=UPI003A97B7F5